jgi:hypothetical protein
VLTIGRLAGGMSPRLRRWHIASLEAVYQLLKDRIAGVVAPGKGEVAAVSARRLCHQAQTSGPPSDVGVTRVTLPCERAQSPTLIYIQLRRQMLQIKGSDLRLLNIACCSNASLAFSPTDELSLGNVP